MGLVRTRTPSLRLASRRASRRTPLSPFKTLQTSDTSSSTGRKRAVLHIPLEMIMPHYDKTLEQAAKAIKISESKLKDTVKYYGYESWSDFKFKVRNALSEKATHSSLTTTPHGGDVSNTSGLPVLNPSDQSIPVVLEAANVDQAATAYLVNATMFSSRPHEMSTQPIQAYGGTRFGFPSQNQLVTTFRPETSSVSLSHVGVFSNTLRFPVLNPSDQHNLQMPVLRAGNVNYSDAAYSVNATTFPSLPHEMPTQQIQAYAGTHFGFPPETSAVSLFCGGDVSNPFLNESNKHNLPMQGLDAANVDQAAAAYSVNATMFSSRPHEMSTEPIQAYGGTQPGVPPQNQLITTFRPETSNDSLFRGGDVSNPVLNESNHHSMPMSVHEAANLHPPSAPSSSWSDEILMQQTQGYGGTNDLSGFQPQNQSVTMSLPETTMQDDSAAVIVKATFGETDIMFQLFPWSKMEDLNGAVMKKLNLGGGSFWLKYLNKEGDWIPIGRDADWKVCMDTLRSLNRTAVNILVLPTRLVVDDYLINCN